MLALVDAARKEAATEDTAQQLFLQARNLITSTEEGNRLDKAYFDALQRNPDVAVLHGEVMKVFSSYKKGERAKL